MRFIRDFYLDLEERLKVEQWPERVARSDLPVAVLLALTVAAITFPLIVLRSYYFEEGQTHALAHDALTGGNWYVPELYGMVFFERPVLQSWLVALISWPLGDVNQITNRLPSVIALGSCAFLVFRFLRPRVSKSAALMGAMCFLFSPSVLQKVIVAESDLLLATFQFAAFVVWWTGFERRESGLLRAVAVGLLLAATALFKGPQPAAFFALGVGLFILVHRDWKQLPAYVVAGCISAGILAVYYLRVFQLIGDPGTTLGYMRLTLNDTLVSYLAQRVTFGTATLLGFLPALPIAAPALVDLWRRRPLRDLAPNDRQLFLALVFYAGVALAFLSLWPGANGRYVMPAVPAMAVMAGLAYDRLLARSRSLIRAAIGVLGALIAYQLVLNWIATPITVFRPGNTRLDARTIDSVAVDRQRAVLAHFRTADAILAYLDRPVRYLAASDLAAVQAPAYMLIPEDLAQQIAQMRPDLAISERATMGSRPLKLYEVVAAR